MNNNLWEKTVSRTSRLEDALDIDGGNDELDEMEVYESDDWKIKITAEMRELDKVAELALQTYEAMMNSMHLTKPEQRIKYLEVAHKYLSEAKDAINKRDVLTEKRIDRETKIKHSGQPTKAGEGKTDSQPTGTTTRAELEKKLAERRNLQ